MAYKFTTKYGSEYQVRDGRLDRVGDHEIVDAEGHPTTLTIRKVLVAPTLGVRAIFDTFEVGRFSTSRVDWMCDDYSEQGLPCSFCAAQVRGDHLNF